MIHLLVGKAYLLCNIVMSMHKSVIYYYLVQLQYDYLEYQFGTIENNGLDLTNRSHSEIRINFDTIVEGHPNFQSNDTYELSVGAYYNNNGESVFGISVFDLVFEQVKRTFISPISLQWMAYSDGHTLHKILPWRWGHYDLVKVN